jgi:hypothetical protein
LGVPERQSAVILKHLMINQKCGCRLNTVGLELDSVAELHHFDATPNPTTERKNDAAPAPTLTIILCIIDFKTQKSIYFDAAPAPAMEKM